MAQKTQLVVLHTYHRKIMTFHYIHVRNSILVKIDMVIHYTGLRGKDFIQNIKEKERGYLLKPKL